MTTTVCDDDDDDNAISEGSEVSVFVCVRACVCVKRKKAHIYVDLLGVSAFTSQCSSGKLTAT